MAKAELGTKRVCPNCGAKYYDLNKTPPVCPKCGTEFIVANAKARPQEAEEKPKEEEPEKSEETPTSVETISLEEADAEISGGKEGSDEEGEEIAVADDSDDDTFLENDEDEGDDVTDIIGDVDDNED